MKSAIIILSLMGCDDAGQNCEAIQVNNAHFSTQEECLRASENFFEAQASANYPMVMAKCDLNAQAVLTDRPVNPDADAVDSEHEIATVDLSRKPIEENGWFRLDVKKSVSKVTKPVADVANNIADSGQNTANWLVDRAWAALDYVNPF